MKTAGYYRRGRSQNHGSGRHMAARYLVALALSSAVASDPGPHGGFITSLVTIACWTVAAVAAAGLIGLAVCHVRFRSYGRPARPLRTGISDPVVIGVQASQISGGPGASPRDSCVIEGLVLRPRGRRAGVLYELSDADWAIVEGRDQDGGRP